MSDLQFRDTVEFRQEIMIHDALLWSNFHNKGKNDVTYTSGNAHVRAGFPWKWAWISDFSKNCNLWSTFFDTTMLLAAHHLVTVLIILSNYGAKVRRPILLHWPQYFIGSSPKWRHSNLTPAIFELRTWTNFVRHVDRRANDSTILPSFNKIL